jgi:glycosyltransferase involved in cell wall biosynthesis
MHCAARFSLKHADLLRAISASTRKQLVTWQPGKPIFQFATWTDIEPFLQNDETSKRRSKEVLYAGVLIPLKGVHHLISAFAYASHDLPLAGLVIVGREENKAYAAELKKQVERVGLNGRIRFLGEVSQVELARWMRQACVLVLPSFSEGLGRVVLEAMATGTPVIGSSVGGIPELVQDGVTGFLVPAGDETALAERLRWVFVHPEEAAEMGRRARTFAERFFSTGVYVAGYRQIFEAAQALLNEKDECAPSTL